MRVLVSSAVVAFALFACSSPDAGQDASQPFDSGSSFDVQASDTPTTPTDTNTGPIMCDFVPGAVNPTCRVLSQTCTTGPVACDGGTTIPMITCQCQMVRMFGQVWRCDDFCGNTSDASTQPTDAAAE